MKFTGDARFFYVRNDKFAVAMIPKPELNLFTRKIINVAGWRGGVYISSFFLNLAIANFMGAENSGPFYLLISNLAFAVMILSLGLDVAISYYASKNEVKVGLLYVISISWSLIATGIIMLLYKILSVQGFIAKNKFAAYCLFYIGLNILTNCLTSIYFARHDNRSPNLVLLFVNIVLILLVPGLFVTENLMSIVDYTRIYLVLNCLPAIMLTLMLFSLGQTAAPNRKRILVSLKRVVPFALSAFLANMLLALMMRCDYWIVNYFCDDNQLGNYLQASKLTQVILVIPTVVSSSLMAIMVSHAETENDLEQRVSRLTQAYSLISMAICLLVGATGYWVVPWIYGKSFSDVYLVLLLTAPGSIAFSATFPKSTYFFSRNKMPVLVAGLIGGISLLLLLDFSLVPRFKIYGAAFGSSVCFIFYYLYISFYFNRYRRSRNKIPGADLRPSAISTI